MTGFANIGEWGDAHENGQTSFFSYRKAPSQASVGGWWVDLSMTAGNPPPNYYAAAPLVATALDGDRGLFHGAAQSPAKKYLSRMTLQTPNSALVGRYILLDYLLFYPFVDGDEAAPQEMDNTVTLPRWTSGAGVQAMFVCVAPTVGGGTFTFDYVNQDGVTKTSPLHSYTTTGAGITSLLTSQFATAAGYGPFLRLADGDTGIRSIVSLSNVVLNGGLGTIVLVKPIADLAVREANNPTEFIFLEEHPLGAQIVDGAYLNLIVNCGASVAAAILQGFGQFVWG